MSNNYAVVCARVEALVPAWRARAAETERTRIISPETIRELHENELLQILTPRRYGGLGRRTARVVWSLPYTTNLVQGNRGSTKQARRPKWWLWLAVRLLTDANAGQSAC